MSNKSKQVVAFWKKESKNGSTFHVSGKLKFADFRRILKEFKEEENVLDTDDISFFLFKVDSEHEKAPQLQLTLRKEEEWKRNE